MPEAQAKYGAIPEQTSKTAQGNPGSYHQERRRKADETETIRLERSRRLPDDRKN